MTGVLNPNVFQIIFMFSILILRQQNGTLPKSTARPQNPEMTSKLDVMYGHNPRHKWKLFSFAALGRWYTWGGKP